MICKHLLALIDALPLAEYPPGQLEAAERHARDCVRCRSALTAAKALEIELHRQPEPAPPAGLAAAIIARTARLDDERATTSRDASWVAAIKARSDRRAWAAAIAGLAVGLGAQGYRLLSGESTLNLTSSRIGGGMDGVIELLHGGPAVVVLAAGLLLYLAGLFALLGTTEAPPARPPAR